MCVCMPPPMYLQRLPPPPTVVPPSAPTQTLDNGLVNCPGELVSTTLFFFSVILSLLFQYTNSSFHFSTSQLLHWFSSYLFLSSCFSTCISLSDFRGTTSDIDELPSHNNSQPNVFHTIPISSPLGHYFVDNCQN